MTFTTNVLRLIHIMMYFKRHTQACAQNPIISAVPYVGRLQKTLCEDERKGQVILLLSTALQTKCVACIQADGHSSWLSYGIRMIYRLHCGCGWAVTLLSDPFEAAHRTTTTVRDKNRVHTYSYSFLYSTKSVAVDVILFTLFSCQQIDQKIME